MASFVSLNEFSVIKQISSVYKTLHQLNETNLPCGSNYKFNCLLTFTRRCENFFNLTSECKSTEHESICCDRIHIRELKINEEACINVTYIYSTLTLSFALTIGSKTWLSDTLSCKYSLICVNITSGGPACLR